jgi:hypothetical protein
MFIFDEYNQAFEKSISIIAIKKCQSFVKQERDIAIYCKCPYATQYFITGFAYNIRENI